jgi:hypothetical protein
VLPTLSNGLWEEEKAVSMSMFYHIPHEGEYRLVHRSNALIAILSEHVASALPFLSAELMAQALPPENS